MGTFRHAGLFVATVLVLALVACDRNNTSARADAAASTPSGVYAATEPNPMPPNSTTDGPSSDAVEARCEGIIFRVTPSLVAEGATTMPPTNTDLARVDSMGTVTPIAKPAEMADYTAVGVGCAVANTDHEPYFVVQYGERPFGCKFCEWFYLYDGAGKQLTTSNPPILVDESLPEGDQRASNTQEYEQLLGSLGLAHPDMTFLPNDGDAAP